MILKDFLVSSGTDEGLTELILFLSTQAQLVKRGFLATCMKTPSDECTRNVYGEEQMPLDKYADQVFISGLRKTRLARYVATEEQEQIIEIDNPKYNFGVVIDPLDGSSLIDVNLCTGSIIGIYPGRVLDTNLNYRFSLPNKLFDYIHAGIPVLASPLPEVQKIISEYHIGEFVPFCAPKEMAQRITAVLASEKLQEYKKNTQRAKTELNWAEEKKKLLAVISDANQTVLSNI